MGVLLCVSVDTECITHDGELVGAMIDSVTLALICRGLL